MNTDSDNSTLNVRFSHCGIWDEFGDGKISSCTLTILVLCFSAKEEHLLINAHCVRILMLFCVQTIDVKWNKVEQKYVKCSHAFGAKCRCQSELPFVSSFIVRNIGESNMATDAGAVAVSSET